MRENTKKLTKFSQELKAVLKKSVVLGAVGRHAQADMSNSDLILIHEFGNKAKNLPARSPIRKTFSDKKVADRLGKNFFRSLMTLIENEAEPEPALELVGQSMVLEIQRKINEGLSPALSENYLQRKTAMGYSSLPLVKTEQLINSFSFEVRE